MKQVKTAGDASPNLTARDMFRMNLELVQKVAQTYAELNDLPVVTAQQIDPSPVTHSRKWTPTSCHFQIDVQQTVTKALEHRADSESLLKDWHRLLDNEGIADKHHATVVRVLAPHFRRNQLSPMLYFRSINRGSPLRGAA